MIREPWRYYEEDSTETGPPRVIVYGYDGLPIQPVAPLSPDYVPGPEHPPSPDYVPGPKHPPSPAEVPYVPKPEYPEYLAPFDDEAPLEDQPLPRTMWQTLTRRRIRRRTPRMIRLTILLMEGMVMMSPPMMTMMMILTMRIHRRSPLRRMTKRRRSTSSDRLFCSHVPTKEAEDMSKEKRLEDVPIVQDFPEVFPEDFP
nr:hypothetical protein [Tanacetum cinerariifolium]